MLNTDLSATGRAAAVAEDTAPSLASGAAGSTRLTAPRALASAHGTTWVEWRTFLERGIVSSTHVR